MASIEDLIAIKNAVEEQYLAQPGVTGVDVGYKNVGGEQTDQIAIRIHVAEKRHDVPEAERIPAEIDGAVTDVLERRYEPQVAAAQLDAALQVDMTHYTTLEGGISMGPSRAINGFVYAGTLGAIVIDKVNNQRAALTNFHVACVDSGWQVGDRQVQPSRNDHGVPSTDEFGAIVRAVLSGAVDGAVVSIDAGRTSSGQVVEIGNVRGTAAAQLGAAVRKRGRTTGLTYGSVDGVSATVTLDYGDGLGVRTLTNQISIAADTTRNPLFSDHGDSGSVIMDMNGYVIGLLFAGAGAGTVANPIASVLAELNVSLLLGKSVLKDFKDGHKDLIKDKEIALEVPLRAKLLKDISDGRPKVVEGSWLPKPGPIINRPPVVRPPAIGSTPADGVAELSGRLSALENTLGALTSFIAADLRPDLSQSAFSGEQAMDDADTAQLRAEIQQQIDDSVSAKAELDTPYG